jgi:hypothetical protein
VGSAAMTTIRLNSALAAELLLAHLRERPEIVAEITGPNTLNVTVIGSYRLDAMQMELALRLRAWEEATRAKGLAVRAELVTAPRD